MWYKNRITLDKIGSNRFIITDFIHKKLQKNGNGFKQYFKTRVSIVTPYVDLLLMIEFIFFHKKILQPLKL